MKRLAYLLLLLAIAGCNPKPESTTIVDASEFQAPDVREYRDEIYHYQVTHPGYRDDIAFVADLSRPEGQDRFFVLDMANGKIIEHGLCLNGKTTPDGKVIYSNEPGSGCSSHGMAAVSYRYKGSFGKAYKLKGLEPSNSNIFNRSVVLHSWRGVPKEAVNYDLTNSEGCPTVNPEYLETLSTYIDEGKGKILLYIL